MRLGIDLDGVVADFNEGWMRLYNDDFGTDLVPEMVRTWDVFLDLTHFKSSAAFWKWARNDRGPGLFRNLPLFPGALESLNRLSRNHSIVIITTKPRWANAETFAWIADNNIPTREVHITGRKWEVDCDVYLDDGPHNLEALVLERPDRTTCRFVRPWNQNVPGAVDVDTWDTFEALVDKQFC
jgi:5'(3')-deoxyribonucleotidase